MASQREQHTSPDQQSARKRRKITRACDACKNRKKACTGKIPCASCVKNRVRCTYDCAYNRGVAAPPQPSTSVPDDHADIQNHNIQGPDAGITQIGKQASCDANHANKSAMSNAPLRKLSPEPESADIPGQYSGPTSAHSFLDRAIQKFSEGLHQSVWSPSDERQATGSIFSFGDRNVPEVNPADWSWPDRKKAQDLTKRYFDFASPTYRVLHQGTVEEWVEACCQPLTLQQSVTPANNALAPPATTAARAIILMVCATGSMFQPERTGNMTDADDLGWQQSEMYYRMADQLLSNEAGSPCLESVQARFLTVLYLLSSSRMNKAWYVFGTAVQLLLALGIHRKQKAVHADAPTATRVLHECQKRVLWCSFTLDKYLSLMLGRPRLLREDEINQEFPAMINDEDLNERGRHLRPGRDCMMAASVYHAQLSQILARVTKDLYANQSITADQQAESIVDFTAQISAWHDQLPPTLSGAIHPSSLIATFRRQLTVLQLAHDHAVMFVTRPLLLRDYAKILPDFASSYRRHLSICIRAARDTVELVLYFVKEEHLFTAFWFTQYITFNALSIIYIYLIQIQRGRIPVSLTKGSADFDCTKLYELADKAQHHLAQATIRNSPLWRYSAILQGLRGEILRHPQHNPNAKIDAAATPQMNHPRATPNDMQPNGSQMAEPLAAAGFGDAQKFPGYEGIGDPSQQSYDPMLSGMGIFNTNQMDLLDSFSNGADLQLDFWTQMDSFPMPQLGM